MYYTTVKDRAALNPHYGTVQVKGDFVPEAMPDVQYFYFQAPARTWTFAQSTMYTGTGLSLSISAFQLFCFLDICSSFSGASLCSYLRSA